MERHQDWCLECGTAAPGRLGGVRPGWRAVSTTLALTLVLMGGAGAASYAALTTDADRAAIAAGPAPGAVAQAPPVAPPPPAAPVGPTGPVPEPAAPKVKAEAPAPPVAPKVTTVTPVAPVPPPDDKTLAQVTPPPAKKQTPPASTPRSDDTAAGSRGEGTNADGEDAAGDIKLKPIVLAPGSVSLYDPYKRALAPGNPAEAHDGNAQTTFEVGAPDDGKELQVGVVIDLQAVKQVRGIDFTTTTPGGRVEVYATDGSTVPPDILDTRWDHPASRADVDGDDRGGNRAGDGAERILFPKGGATYRYVTLWFTTPPEGATSMGLTELTVLG